MLENLVFLAQEASSVGGSVGDVMAGIVVLGILLTIFTLLIIGWWIYTSLAWSSIFRKLKNPKPEKAWIPFVRGAAILELGNLNWQLIFLYLVPVLGWIALWVLMMVASWRIYEKRSYPGWLALAPILTLVIGGLFSIIDLVILGVVAWRDEKKSKKPAKKLRKRKLRKNNS